jgi:hypothetical protein
MINISDQCYVGQSYANFFTITNPTGGSLLVNQGGTIQITPFQAAPICGSSNTFQYSGSLSGGSSLPNYITVSQSSGAVTASNTASFGNYSIKISGVLPNN